MNDRVETLLKHIRNSPCGEKEEIVEILENHKERLTKLEQFADNYQES